MPTSGVGCLEQHDVSDNCSLTENEKERLASMVASMALKVVKKSGGPQDPDLEKEVRFADLKDALSVLGRMSARSCGPPTAARSA